MKNADLPAMPNDTDTETLSIVHEVHNFNDFLRFRTGLTKREMFAMTAMQGVLASGVWDEYKYVARVSVEMADALLAKLDETKS